MYLGSSIFFRIDDAKLPALPLKYKRSPVEQNCVHKLLISKTRPKLMKLTLGFYCL